MPTPKQMAWIVALAAGTFFALQHVQSRQAAGGTSRYGR